MKRKIFKFSLFLLLCANLGYAKLEIIVKSMPDWGPISDADVEYLCQEIVDRFEEHLRPENEINASVNVSRSHKGFSRFTWDIDDPHVEYKIDIQLREGNLKIAIADFSWFICALGHEFTHLMQHDQKSVHYSEITNQNLWFREAIAEMACVWAFKSMADAWINDVRFGPGVATPGGIALWSENFDNWANWYQGLFSYHGTAEEWLAEHQENMRSNYNQEVSAGLGFKLLPVFEENPEAWNAVRKMPVTNTEKMDRYMQVWYDAVDIQDRQYVEAIAEIMGITVTSKVTPPILASTGIDADVNNDGYVDLYDVMIVRSAMQNSTSYDTDLNNDGVTDEVDLHIVKSIAMQAIAAAAPRKRKVNLTTWGSMKMR